MEFDRGSRESQGGVARAGASGLEAALDARVFNNELSRFALADLGFMN